MSYRLLLDENVEWELYHRLDDAGHDVEHVDDVPDLGKSSVDEDVAAYSLETDRIILTYDADFVLSFADHECRGVFHFSDESLPTGEVAAVVDTISKYYPQEEVTGVVHAGREWL